jgi:hypothetical protein
MNNNPINVQLRQNNILTTPGYYLMKRTIVNGNPYLAHVRPLLSNSKELHLFFGMSGFPLKDLEKDAWWSDQVSIDFTGDK